MDPMTRRGDLRSFKKVCGDIMQHDSAVFSSKLFSLVIVKIFITAVFYESHLLLIIGLLHNSHDSSHF